MSPQAYDNYIRMKAVRCLSIAAVSATHFESVAGSVDYVDAIAGQCGR